MACPHGSWAIHTVVENRASHAIIAFGQYTLFDDVAHGMSSSPLGSTHGQTMSCVACCHPLGQHTLSDHVGRGMPTWPLGSTYGRMTLGMACHYFLCATHIGEVGHDIPSSPLGNTHDRMTSGMAYHHRPLIAYMVRRRLAWHAILTLDKIYDRTMSGVEFHHILWTAHTVERRRAWHAIITHGQHTRSKELGRGILSSLLNRTYFRTTSNVASLHGPCVAHYRTVSRKACHLLPWRTSTIGQCRV